MATADPPPDESSDELGGRPTLTQHQSSRGNRLASDDPSAPGPDGRFSARHHDVDVEHDASHRSEERQRNHSGGSGGIHWGSVEDAVDSVRGRPRASQGGRFV